MKEVNTCFQSQRDLRPHEYDLVQHRSTVGVFLRDLLWSGLPDLFLQKEVEVETPEGLGKLRNPLESYTFQGDVAMGNAGLSRGVSRQSPNCVPALQYLCHLQVT